MTPYGINPSRIRANTPTRKRVRWVGRQLFDIALAFTALGGLLTLINFINNF